MEGPTGLVQSNERKARLLVLYTHTADAAILLERLPSESYEVISCPVTVLEQRWLEDMQPDLILLDPPMEKKPLLATCERLRAQTECPIVVLSDRSEEVVVAQVLAAGIDEYLVRPIGERELTARIGAMLRRLSWRELTQVGGLTISSADLSVERNGRKVFLSPIEFRLLACLTSAPGKVLTHQTLMARVWGAEYVDSRHYLRVYIRYLREKLEDAPSHPEMILSEWGIGYRFEPQGTASARAFAHVDR